MMYEQKGHRNDQQIFINRMLRNFAAQRAANRQTNVGIYADRRKACSANPIQPGAERKSFGVVDGGENKALQVCNDAKAIISPAQSRSENTAAAA
jgi:hypothetical protein